MGASPLGCQCRCLARGLTPPRSWAAFRRDRQSYAAAHLGELGGVVQQIGKDLRQPDPIAEYPNGLIRQLAGDSQALLFHGTMQIANGQAHEAGQVLGFQVQADFLMTYAEDVEQIVHQSGQDLRLPIEDIAQLPEVSGRRAAEVEQVHGVANGGERVA